MFDFPPYKPKESPGPRTKRDYHRGVKTGEGTGREKETRRHATHAGFIASAPHKVWHVARGMIKFILGPNPSTKLKRKESKAVRRRVGREQTRGAPIFSYDANKATNVRRNDFTLNESLWEDGDA